MAGIDKDIALAYGNLANAVICSSINDWVNWQVQEYFYPPDKEIEMLREESKGNKVRFNNLRNRHYQVVQNGLFAKHFLEREESIRIFTSYTSEELMSFARRKLEMVLEEMQETGVKKRLRHGRRRTHGEI